jgi:hypothetical protein
VSDETTDTDSAAVLAVADEIAALHGPLPPLSAEEIEQREIEHELWLYEQHQRAEQQRIARERAQAEAADRAQRESAIAAEQSREKARREFQERDRSRQQVSGIYDRLTRAEAFRNDVVAGARRNAVIQHQQALIADLEKTINPPPEPEPQIVVIEQPQGSPRLGDPDFNPNHPDRWTRNWW